MASTGIFYVVRWFLLLPFLVYGLRRDFDLYDRPPPQPKLSVPPIDAHALIKTSISRSAPVLGFGALVGLTVSLLRSLKQRSGLDADEDGDDQHRMNLFLTQVGRTRGYIGAKITQLKSSVFSRASKIVRRKQTGPREFTENNDEGLGVEIGHPLELQENEDGELEPNINLREEEGNGGSLDRTRSQPPLDFEEGYNGDEEEAYELGEDASDGEDELEHGDGAHEMTIAEAEETGRFALAASQCTAPVHRQDGMCSYRHTISTRQWGTGDTTVVDGLEREIFEQSEGIHLDGSTTRLQGYTHSAHSEESEASSTPSVDSNALSHLEIELKALRNDTDDVWLVLERMHADTKSDLETHRRNLANLAKELSNEVLKQGSVIEQSVVTGRLEATAVQLLEQIQSLERKVESDAKAGAKTEKELQSALSRAETSAQTARKRTESLELRLTALESSLRSDQRRAELKSAVSGSERAVKKKAAIKRTVADKFKNRKKGKKSLP
jgi:hypothetical protein